MPYCLLAATQPTHSVAHGPSERVEMDNFPVYRPRHHGMTSANGYVTLLLDIAHIIAIRHGSLDMSNPTSWLITTSATTYQTRVMSRLLRRRMEKFMSLEGTVVQNISYLIGGQHIHIAGNGGYG